MTDGKMSGRDLRNFMLAHRADARETDQLVQRVTDGMYSAKYKAVDYDALRAITQRKKFEGQAALVKVKKIQNASKRGKEQNLVNQHKGVWHKELLRLNTLQRKMETELAYNINQGSSDDSNGLAATFEMLESTSEQLAKARQQFKLDTYDPVMDLRNDLHYMAERGACDNPDQVMGEVQKVQNQQAAILERLAHEEQRLEQELSAGELPSIDELHDFCNYTRLEVQTGIPEEAFDLPCPDSDFKASVLQEFLLVDHRYVQKLQALEEEHATIARSSTGGWSMADQRVFMYCTEQYTPSLTIHRAHRMLAIDMMRRHMPHHTRAAIVEHEEWWLYFQHYHRRTRALLTDWLRERAELLERARSMFSEMCALAEQRRAQQELSRHQKQLCDELYLKVSKWREEKQEMMRLEEEMEERRREEKLEALRREEEKERDKRDKQKQKIQQFKAERTREETEKEKRDLARLEELKKRHVEQAAVDKERVEYRLEQQQQKQESQAEKERQRQQEEQDKEAVLEALRQKVRPHVEGDLLRLWSDTKTWQAHTKATEEFINIQQPLYNINSFTAKQLAGDKRLQMDNELRAMGLQNHPHARFVLAQMPPPRQPRPDMASTVFKMD